MLCTRDRAAQLPATLEAWREQRCAHDWELILVDNGSRDATPRLLADFAAAAPMRVRLVRESRPGLAAARNAGLRAARGDLIAYTDDDCYPAPDWLARVADVLGDPATAYCGGRVLLFDPRDLPLTIQERAAPLIIEPDTFVPSGLIHGANMAFRRAVLLKAQGFDERLGAGAPFRSGEDTDLLRRLSWSGLRGRYDPRLLVHHHHGRRHPEQARRLGQCYDAGVAAVMAKWLLHAPTRGRLFRHLYWHARTQNAGALWRQAGWMLRFAWRCRFSGRRAWAHPHAALLD
ncbi:MAG: glycosyltransferase family 2 protein [Chromatiaceae bacterium]|nr:glycosyltransferase family 2 protein [Chromatiaceae bacterium]